MSEREKLLESIAEIMADYRMSELPKATPEHVDRWIRQFDAKVQVPILREMNHVLGKTYFSFQKVVSFLEEVITTEELVGADPCKFWRSARFLNIQGGGNSQQEMLALLDQVLQKSCGFGVMECGNDPAVFIYLDDAIFSGGRVKQDLEAWVQGNAPAAAKLHVITIALHRGGEYYANKCILDKAKTLGKEVNITWWREVYLEDRKSYTDSSDVLRPVSIPDLPEVQEYVGAMKYPPVLRRPGSLGDNSFFSSEEGRNLLEQEFLKAGVRIRQIAPNLPNIERPLGHMYLETLGFGSLLVTFRNCPNNAPLALWVGAPWYPLFARTTNSQTEVRRMFKKFTRGRD